MLKDRLAQLTPSAEAAWRLRGAEAEGERAAMGAIARLRASLKVQQLKGRVGGGVWGVCWGSGGLGKKGGGYKRVGGAGVGGGTRVSKGLM